MYWTWLWGLTDDCSAKHQRLESTGCLNQNISSLYLSVQEFLLRDRQWKRNFPHQLDQAGQCKSVQEYSTEVPDLHAKKWSGSPRIVPCNFLKCMAVGVECSLIPSTLKHAVKLSSLMIYNFICPPWQQKHRLWKTSVTNHRHIPGNRTSNACRIQTGFINTLPHYFWGFWSNNSMSILGKHESLTTPNYTFSIHTEGPETVSEYRLLMCKLDLYTPDHNTLQQPWLLVQFQFKLVESYWGAETKGRGGQESRASSVWRTRSKFESRVTSKSRAGAQDQGTERGGEETQRIG